MAKVRYWNPDKLTTVESQRDYVEFRVKADYMDEYFPGSVNMRLYIDDETGLVVTDLFTFEKWMRKVG